MYRWYHTRTKLKELKLPTSLSIGESGTQSENISNPITYFRLLLLWNQSRSSEKSYLNYDQTEVKDHK